MALRTKQSEIPGSDEFAPSGPFAWRVFRYRLDRMLPYHLSQGPGSELKNVLVLDADGDSHVYAPLMEHQDLFILFAEVQTDDDVLRFAGKFGHLKAASYSHFIRSSVRSGQSKMAETIEEWLSEATAMSEVIDLWSRIKENRLEGIIEWKKRHVLYHPNPDSTVQIAVADGQNAHAFHGWKHGERKAPAEFELATIINSHLARNVAPQIGIDQTQSYRLYTRPFNLLGAIWLQMAQACTGEQKVKKCRAPGCDRWLIYKRSSKTMHDDCANRLRQQRFMERHSAKTKTRKQ
jgi:hypothetical protein